MKPPSSAILVLDVLAASAKGEMSAQDVCRAGAIMGYSDATMRVALTRLAQQGKIVKRGRATYALNAQANRLQLDVENWRDRVNWIVPWSGDWIVVHDGTASRSDKTGLRRHRRALLLRGFRQWKPGLHVRPNNLLGGAEALRCQLDQLGLAKGAELFVAQGFTERQVSDALRLWNIPALRRGYETILSRVQDGRRRLTELGAEAAARESLLVGRDLIGYVLRDPLLPSEIVAGVQLRELARSIATYQTLSRKIWDRVITDR